MIFEFAKHLTNKWKTNICICHHNHGSYCNKQKKWLHVSHVLFDTSDMLNFLLMNTFWIEKAQALRVRLGMMAVERIFCILCIFCIYLKYFAYFAFVAYLCIFCTFCISTGIETGDGGWSGGYRRWVHGNCGCPSQAQSKYHRIVVGKTCRRGYFPPLLC